MKLTFLGQAGFLVETDGNVIMIDPYLSDSVFKVDPAKKRRVPAEERFFLIRPDFLLFTHDHLDHYDPETADRFLESYDGITVLSPASVYRKVRQTAKGHGHNYVRFDVHAEWTEKNVRFRAVKAVHSDDYAIGFFVTAEEKTLYFTGDTLYNEEIFREITVSPDALFLPVNGVGNNMNAIDAARFAKRVGAKAVFPCHTGMLDDCPVTDFPVKGSKILKPYETVEL